MQSCGRGPKIPLLRGVRGVLFFAVISKKGRLRNLLLSSEISPNGRNDKKVEMVRMHCRLLNWPSPLSPFCFFWLMDMPNPAPMAMPKLIHNARLCTNTPTTLPIAAPNAALILFLLCCSCFKIDCSPNFPLPTSAYFTLVQ